MDLRLKELEKQKEESIKNGCFEEASLLQKEQEEAEEKIGAAEKNVFSKKTSSSQPEVTEEDIAEVVSAWTKIPVQKLAESDTDRLKKLESVLHQRVIGQEEAVKAVARAVKKGACRIERPETPDRFVSVFRTYRRRQKQSCRKRLPKRCSAMKNR